MWTFLFCLSVKYEPGVLESCMSLLQVSPKHQTNQRLDYLKRNDPVYISRVVSAMVRTKNKNIPLQGCQQHIGFIHLMWQASGTPVKTSPFLISHRTWRSARGTRLRRLLAKQSLSRHCDVKKIKQTQPSIPQKEWSVWTCLVILLGKLYWTKGHVIFLCLRSTVRTTVASWRETGREISKTVSAPQRGREVGTSWISGPSLGTNQSNMGSAGCLLPSCVQVFTLLSWTTPWMKSLSKSFPCQRPWLLHTFHCNLFWLFTSVSASWWRPAVMRVLGIPCRVVTNFNSAHDTNGNLVIEEYYSEKGEKLKLSKDSVW